MEQRAYPVKLTCNPFKPLGLEAKSQDTPGCLLRLSGKPVVVEGGGRQFVEVVGEARHSSRGEDLPSISPSRVRGDHLSSKGGGCSLRERGDHRTPESHVRCLIPKSSNLPIFLWLEFH